MKPGYLHKFTCVKLDLEIRHHLARFWTNATESQSGREIRHAAVPLLGGQGSNLQSATENGPISNGFPTF
jgi:hypothetical protein